jgi:RNA polymerase sigma-70 factor, ECF subfamily
VLTAPKLYSARPPRQSPTPDSTVSSAWAHATEAELAHGLQRGDPEAQRAAWNRYLPVVRGMARRRLGSGADVDDVVQEAYLAVFRSVRLLRELSALRAFVLTITARVLNREVRRRILVNAMTSSGDANADSVASDEPDPATKHAYAMLRRLVHRLREREQRAFLLSFMAGMNAAEVANALGVSVPTVRRILSNARRRIEVWASRDPFLAEYLDQR